MPAPGVAKRKTFRTESILQAQWVLANPTKGVLMR